MLDVPGLPLQRLSRRLQAPGNHQGTQEGHPREWHATAGSLRETVPDALRWMRDPTRGGVGTALNELAASANVSIELEEQAIPIRDAVRGACELLGLDALHIANEGQCLAVVAPESAEAALAAWRAVPGGELASIIGHVQETPAGVVSSRTAYGSTRVVDMLVGDPLPRIC